MWAVEESSSLRESLVDVDDGRRAGHVIVPTDILVMGAPNIRERAGRHL